MNHSLQLRRRRVGIVAVLAVALGALTSIATTPPPASAAASDQMVYPATGNIQSKVNDGCRGNYRDHDGIDITGPTGPIVAAADGTISYKGLSDGTGYGHYVDVEHAGGYVTRYAHMAGASPLSVGTFVPQGTQIGTVGNSGTSAIHLHFEVRKNNVLYTAINDHFTCLSNVTRGNTMPGAFPGLSSGTGAAFVKFDINGNAKADLIAVRNDGYLVEFFGNGAGGTESTYVTGAGWATTAALVTGDFNGDGAGDFMQTRTDGGLYFYKGDYASNFTPTYLGAGWASYSLLTGGVDFNSDGRVDLVARGSDSNLYLYPGNGQGSFNNPVQIGTNWSAFTALVAGDFNKDGRGDLMARNSAGELWGYYGTASGFGFIQMLGQGWNGFSSIVSNGDHNGDTNPDIIARRASDQTLWLYPGNGTGGFGNGVQVGNGWGAFPLIS